MENKARMICIFAVVFEMGRLQKQAGVFLEPPLADCLGSL